MFKKKTTLPLRPEPPSVDQIIEDVEGCQDNDIVFASMLNGEEREDSPDPMTESFLGDDDGFPSSPTDPNDAQNIYKKAVTYVKLVDNLEVAPENLQKQSDKLEELKNELIESIDDLKEKSQTALDSSVR